MDSVTTHYATLHVAPSATAEEIEAAYRRLLARMHERIRAGDPPAPERFDRIEAAWAVLRDPVQRRAYDATLGRAAVSAATRTTPDNALRFSFAGSGGEYFRIWIVNLLLSILTLGIYSAWAKVRREQYFHRNLLLDGSGFDYHATPGAILKGRIIALILFGLYSFTQKLGWAIYLPSLLAFALLLPWLLVRAYRFRARNTSYRALHFGFDGAYGGAFKSFVAYGALTVFTAYLALPQWLRQVRLYVVNNLRFGDTRFTLAVPTRAVYQVVLTPFLSLLLLGGGLGWWASQQDPKELTMLGLQYAPYLPFIMLGLVLGSVLIYSYARMRFLNLFWSHTALGLHRFHSDMRFGAYLRVLVKNWVLMFFTLGLYWPWAQVNLARYRATCLEMAVAGNLEAFVAAASESAGALGDEATDMFDMDVGF